MIMYTAKQKYTNEHLMVQEINNSHILGLLK